MIHLVPAGSLLLTGEDTLNAVLEAVRIAKDWRPRNGYGPLAEYDLLAKALSAALSGCGQTDIPELPTKEPEYVNTDQAAQLLGCSPRTARRLAPQLDGKRIGGQWLLDLRAVHEHIDGREPQ